MKITVQAKPKKKKEFVEQVSPDYYLVSVKAPPVEGQANQAVIKSLAKYFGISPSEIFLVSGHTAKMKTFEVPDRLRDLGLYCRYPQLDWLPALQTKPEPPLH